ncbi:hypothetical protein KUTeg_016421 [Tegillarca granosa]|uniref:Uncharacterized protein n=1 Tax=Tegillarca granosa TaxID=220873 RepID=A0ABQ9EPM9_TEGGR|nr:hypothetical protein KUTeg_016421 [Tegillarca granosa]
MTTYKNVSIDDEPKIALQKRAKMKEFIEVEPGNSRTFGYYDLSSRMHYSLFIFKYVNMYVNSFNKNGKPVMTISDPELEYMVLAPDPYHYYQFYEASEISKCKGK